MQITTKIGATKYGEWKVRVHTRPSQYKGMGKYFTSCSIDNPRSNGISLVSHYSQTEEEALKMHLEIAAKAKALFDLVEEK